MVFWAFLDFVVERCLEGASERKIEERGEGERKEKPPARQLYNSYTKCNQFLEQYKHAKIGKEGSTETDS